MDQNKTNEGQRAVVERIAKLLRLSRGTNHAAEAAAALAKAAEIAAAAGLALDGIDADAAEPRIVHEAGGARRRSHSRKRCHGVLCRHFGVDVVGASTRGSIYIGPAINIALAKHIELYLVRQCAAGWAAEEGLKRRSKRRVRASYREFESIQMAEQRRKRSMAACRHAYECGFYAAIDNVLTEHPIRNDSPALASAIERYTAENFNVTSSDMQPPSRKHQAALVSGLVRGYATPCSRPVAGAPDAVMIGGVA